MTPAAIPLTAIGRIPHEGDNAAIAIRPLEAGLRFEHAGRSHRLSHAVLEGHRFAVERIPAGAYLLSWNQPFGRALRDIEAGENLCNDGTLDALRIRQLPFELPPIANFQNAAANVTLDDHARSWGAQVSLYDEPGTFMGYARDGRGTGTRNHLVVIGTTSSTAAFAQRVADSLKGEVAGVEGIDDIVAITHTEGSGASIQNNHDILLRTLSGYLVNPNVGAVLAIDLGGEQVTNATLQAYARDHGYPLERVPHRFHTLGPDTDASFAQCQAALRDLYAPAASTGRTARPLRELRIGLQCGGSDAFSGISANPLVGWMGKELLRHGGSANLAETDELIGAEGYVLANVRDLGTAKAFLARLRVFSERISWHGHSAEGNPTGGNKFRGLYNISLKSIGAARKKDPQVRLDYVIDYAQPMRDPGFYFMDSPGNDLESISGQVGAGCNLILFTTGNGSITNNPLAPTIKLMTTTRRFQLLATDMDINAGRYLDGEPMDELGREAFEYMVAIASGRPSVGERAGHSQVSIWRNWQQSDDSQLQRLSHLPRPSGEPVPLPAIAATPSLREPLPRVGLILPTSLCAGQIAMRIAATLNTESISRPGAIARYVALVHTEGCGASSGENEEHLLRTMTGYLRHPLVERALLLEHGCERTHNDMMRHALQRAGVDARLFGYASIQLDGGIDKVVAKACRWFHETRPATPPTTSSTCLSIGVSDVGACSAALARAVGKLVARVVSAAGSVVIPRCAAILRDARFLAALGDPDLTHDTLNYGESPVRPGLHLMATPSAHDVEVLSGLGATGVGVILLLVQEHARQANPLVPTVQVASATAADRYSTDIDLLVEEQADSAQAGELLLDLLRAAARDDYRPRAAARGLHHFQLTRGYLGVSL